MIDLQGYEVWFVTGSQHLYGPKTLETVAEHSREIAAALGASAHVPVKVVFKPVVKTPDEISNLCREANNAPNCVGLITWMHTFSPAKMWISCIIGTRMYTDSNDDGPWRMVHRLLSDKTRSFHDRFKTI